MISFLRPKNFLFACVGAVVGLLILFFVTSCGLKGPLYRPDETKNETVAPTENSTDASKKKPGESTAQPPAIDPDRPAVPPGH
jgi:predicted small lipoprotein YifL